MPAPRKATRAFHLHVLAAIVAALAGCSSPKGTPQSRSAACTELARTVAAREDAFVARVKQLRSQPILMRDYDRQMIAAITELRARLEATTLTEMSVSDSVSGCSGQPLDDIRSRVQQQMVNLRAYLNDFKRALKSDPEGVYVDQP